MKKQRFEIRAAVNSYAGSAIDGPTALELLKRNVSSEEPFLAKAKDWLAGAHRNGDSLSLRKDSSPVVITYHRQEYFPQ